MVYLPTRLHARVNIYSKAYKLTHFIIDTLVPSYFFPAAAGKVNNADHANLYPLSRGRTKNNRRFGGEVLLLITPIMGASFVLSILLENYKISIEITLKSNAL